MFQILQRCVAKNMEFSFEILVTSFGCGRIHKLLEFYGTQCTEASYVSTNIFMSKMFYFLFGRLGSTENKI